MQATSTARLNAEIKVLQDNPSKWLQSGPGRETGNSPGWTVPVKPIIRENNQTINILTNPQMQTLFAAILQMLEPFLEARAAVSQALAGRPALDHKP